VLNKLGCNLREGERERESESALSSILQTEVAKFGVGVHITG